MIYDFNENSFNDLPFLDWRGSPSGYTTQIVKNGKTHTAFLDKMENSYKLRLQRDSDKMIILEIRVRSLDIEEVMSKAEYYLISGI